MGQPSTVTVLFAVGLLAIAVRSADNLEEVLHDLAVFKTVPDVTIYESLLHHASRIQPKWYGRQVRLISRDDGRGSVCKQMPAALIRVRQYRDALAWMDLRLIDR